MSLSKQDLPSVGTESSGGYIPPVEHEMSLEEAIGVFISVSERREELKREVEQAMEVLQQEAWETRGEQNTVRLADHKGRTLKVEFKSTYKCDTNLLNVARELLGDDRFEDL